MTFRRISEIGLGWFNLMPDQLDDLTLSEFFYKLNGYVEVTTETERRRLEAARLTAWIVISSFSEKPVRLTDIVRFDWENGQAVKIMPKERFNELKNTWKLR